MCQGSCLHSDNGVPGHHCAICAIRIEAFLRKAMPYCLTKASNSFKCPEHTSQEAQQASRPCLADKPEREPEEITCLTLSRTVPCVAASRIALWRSRWRCSICVYISSKIGPYLLATAQP